MTVLKPLYKDIGGGWKTADADDEIINLRLSRRVITDDYTVTEKDSFLSLKHDKPITITVSTAFINEANRMFEVKDETGNVSINEVTIATEEGQTIDGLDELPITSDYSLYQFYTDGSNLFIR